MYRRQSNHTDIYTELCPATSLAIICGGIIAITMGQLQIGFAAILIGVGVGVATPPRELRPQRITRHRHY